MKNRIKIGQIGIGHNHASEKMKALRRFPDIFEVIGVVEENPLWFKKRSSLDAYEGLKWMSEEEFLNTPGLQAVTVETDGHDLVPTALRCIEAGKHIHLDKPGGEDIELFETLINKAKQANLTVQLGYMYRYNPAIVFCKEAIKKGMLGNIFEIDAVMSRYDGEEYRKWLMNFKAGAMYIFAGHLIDLIVDMLGKPDKITPFPQKTRQDGLVDHGFAVMEHSGGCVATVRTAVVEVEGMKRRNFIVCGDKGTIEIQPIEPPKVYLTLLEPFENWTAGKQEIPLPSIEGRYDVQMKEFARIVAGEIENPYPLEHELLVQRCLLEACGYALDKEHIVLSR
jgi:predicted dehydrogenase